MHTRSRTARAALAASLCVSALSACKNAPGVQATDPGSPPVSLAAEVQVYPAGVIPGLQIRHRVTAADTVFLRLAANLTDRRDFGEHDHESGAGGGGGIGWRHSLAAEPGGSGWVYGARVDVWGLHINWRDPGPRRGSTDIVVVQPSVEGGYGWTYESGSRLELMLGLGAEINVHTDGEDVGEGAILLLGVTYVP